MTWYSCAYCSLARSILKSKFLIKISMGFPPWLMVYILHILQWYVLVRFSNVFVNSSPDSINGSESDLTILHNGCYSGGNRVRIVA